MQTIVVTATQWAEFMQASFLSMTLGAFCAGMAGSKLAEFLVLFIRSRRRLARRRRALHRGMVQL